MAATLTVIEKSELDRLFDRLDLIEDNFNRVLKENLSLKSKGWFTPEQLAHHFEVETATILQWKDEIGYMKKGERVIRFHYDNVNRFADRYNLSPIDLKEFKPKARKNKI